MLTSFHVLAIQLSFAISEKANNCLSLIFIVTEFIVILDHSQSTTTNIA